MKMQISNTNNYVYNQSFRAASDITIKYVAENHAKYLPKRVLDKIHYYLNSGEKNFPSLRAVHDEVYRPLFESTSLDEVKEIYPELKDVVCAEQYSGNRSVAIKIIKSLMPLKDFTLRYLKDVYKMLSQPQLAKKYGFTNRSLVMWINEKLHIKCFDSPYAKLLLMSDEKENARIAECSRQAIYKNPELQRQRQEKAIKHHRTIEYRDKKRQEMKDFYVNHPEVVEKTRKIVKATWDRCPEIKAAMAEYNQTRDLYTKHIMAKKSAGKKLSEEERRVACGYYKEFWESNPEFKEIYQQRRIEVIEEMSNLGK